MCLIIHRDDNTAINPTLLAQGIADNPHGWGIMTTVNGRIHTLRGMDAKEFFPALDALDGLPMSIHFRYATHGAKGIDNCHPFDILGGAYSVMHNGIIDVPLADKNRSDTYHFAHHVLAPILAHDPGAFGSAFLAKLLGSIIGYGNKLVILRADGEAMIVNEDEGCWHDGLWLSNRHSLPVTRRASFRSHSLDSYHPNTCIPAGKSVWRDEELEDWDTRDRDARDRDILDWESQDDNERIAPISPRKPEPIQTYYFDLDDLSSLEWDEIYEYVRSDPESATEAIWSHYNRDGSSSELVELTDSDDTERDDFDAR